MIKLQIIGNLGKDAVVNNVNGKSVINFTVAHTEKYKNAQGVQQDKTTWLDCAYWTDRVAIAPYLKKGTQVYAEGQPDVRSYSTKEGTPGASLTLRVQNIQLLGSRNDNNQGEQNNQSFNQPQQSQSSPQMAETTVQEPLDDLPF